MLISIHIQNQLKVTSTLLSHLQRNTISSTMNHLKNIFLMSPLQSHGVATMLNHLPHSTGMKNPLNHTTKCQSHLHISHTTTMNPQLKTITLMNQLLLSGLISMKPQQLNFITMTNQQAATTLTTNHPQLQLQLIITTSHQQTALFTTNHHQFSGQTITKSQPLISIHMNQAMKHTPMCQSLLHMPPITPTNHQLKAMLNTNPHQSHGQITTTSHQLIFTHMMNQLNHIKYHTNHLHITYTTIMKSQLKATLCTNQPQ